MLTLAPSATAVAIRAVAPCKPFHQWIGDNDEFTPDQTSIRWFSNASNARKAAHRLKKLHPTIVFIPYFPNGRTGLIAY